MRLLPGKNKLFPVFLFPLLTASLARMLVSYEWQRSPLRLYHTIDGLDMKGLLGIGEAFYNGAGNFNIYSVLVALSYHLHGESHQVESIVTLQLLCGCITSLLLTYIVLKISGSKTGAVLAGCMAGLYLPELIYETQILKESLYLFFGCAALALLIKSSRKKFSVTASFFAGFFAFMPAMIRISGIVTGLAFSILFGIWLLRKFSNGAIGRKRTLTVLALYLAGTLPAGCIFMGTYFKNGLSGFSSGTSYYIDKGAELAPQSLNISADAAAKGFSPSVYAKKVVSLFKAFESSNNINYYFVKNQFRYSKYFEGPLLLLPLGICGLLLMLIRRRVLKKEGIYFTFLLAYGLPILAFIPLARYRLVLLPVFCAGAAYFIIYLSRTIASDCKKRTLHKSAILVLLYIAVLYWSIPANIPLRSEDFITHGSAISTGRKNLNEAEEYFMRAYEINPDNRSAVLHLSGELARKAKYPEAEAVLRGYLGNHPDDPKCKVNLAVLYNTMIRPDLAEKVILSMKIPDDPKGKTLYYYNLGVSYMLQARKSEADASFKKALETADEQKSQLLKKVIEFNNHNKRP